MTLASGMSTPRKSRVRISILQLGAWRRIWRMTPTNACAPLSGMSSRSTEVMTAWRRPIRSTCRATRAGSSGSFQVGLPVLTWQNPQRRVHVSPRIMNVAVPRSQHSPMFGQAASWHTVCRLSSAILALSSRYIGPPGMGTLNHFGLRSRSDRTSGPRTFRTSIPPGLARERVLCSRGVTASALTPLNLQGVEPGHARPPRRVRARRPDIGATHPRLPAPADRPAPDPVRGGAQARDRGVRAAPLRPEHLPPAPPARHRRARHGHELDRRDLQHVRPRPARRRAARAARRLLALRRRPRRDDRAVRAPLDHVPAHGRPELDGVRHRARRLPRLRRDARRAPAARVASVDALASVPLRDRGAQRDRPQRVALLALPPRARRPAAAPDAPGHGAGGDAGVPRAAARAVVLGLGLAERRYTATGAAPSAASSRARDTSRCRAPCASAKRHAIRLRKHGRYGGRPEASTATEVIATSGRPHGTIHPNGSSELSTLTAKPCFATPCETCSPIDASLRSSTHTPVHAMPSCERPRASMPSSASAAAIARSMVPPYSMTSSLATIG